MHTVIVSARALTLLRRTFAAAAPSISRWDLREDGERAPVSSRAIALADRPLAVAALPQIGHPDGYPEGPRWAESNRSPRMSSIRQVGRCGNQDFRTSRKT